jgi:hypothetical protein
MERRCKKIMTTGRSLKPGYINAGQDQKIRGGSSTGEAEYGEKENQRKGKEKGSRDSIYEFKVQCMRAYPTSRQEGNGLVD